MYIHPKLDSPPYPDCHVTYSGDCSIYISIYSFVSFLLSSFPIYFPFNYPLLRTYITRGGLLKIRLLRNAFKVIIEKFL